MKIVRMWLVCALVLTFAADAWCAGTSGRVALVVSDPARLQEEWPLVGGVPFPKGTLTDPANVRLVDGKGREIASQIERTATWQDGSIRWAMVSAVAATSGRRSAEFGPNVRRSPVVNGVAVRRTERGYTVDTGAAVFSLRADGLGIDTAMVKGAAELWRDGARGAYLVDSQGRRAVCAGRAADIRWNVIVAGPIRVVLRGDGHYVTDKGERVARATVWYWFFRGRPEVKVVHTFYLTQNTDELWMRELGWQVPVRMTGSTRATFDISEAHDTKVWQGEVNAGDTLYAYQDEYPHFLETASHFSIHRVTGAKDQEVISGKALGEWFDLTDGGRGLTIALHDLAEQFPKELVVSRDGMTVKLWSSRNGRELDFRLKKLLPDYFGEWVTRFPNGGKDFYRQPSNATGAAKTHEFWLLPHAGRLDLAATVRRAHAVDERVLLLPDPRWTCESCVLCPMPIQEKDAKRFPAAEAMMSEFFDRSVLGLRAFPTTGFIAWGCNPFLHYGRTTDGRWYAGYYRLQYLIEYNLRRNAWLMFARSGERKYYEYVSRFDWFAADWSMNHEDFGRKVRGGFARQGNYHYPVFWGDRSEVLYTECSGTDLFNWYTAYYMTGDLRSLEVVHEFRDAVLRGWESAMKDKKYRTGAAFMTLRLLVQLYMEKWDARLGEIARTWAHKILDPNSPNGITDDQPYGFLYKVSRNLCSVLEYWQATDDPVARQCYLKGVDYNRRFARVSHPISYQNGQAAFYTMAYRWTRDPKWLRTANAIYQAGLAGFEAEPRLADELAPGLGKIKRLPFRGPHLNLHPLYCMPIVMKALTEAKGPIGPAVCAARGESDTVCRVVLRKPAARACTIDLAYAARPEDGFDPVILGPDGRLAARVEVNVEKMHYWKSASGRTDYTPKPGQPWRLSTRVTLPADLPAGDYRIDIRDRSKMLVVASDVDKLVVECPDGVFIGAGSVYGYKQYFRVPEHAREVRFFCSRSVVVRRSDGSAADSGDNPGSITVPTNGVGGLWSVSATFPTFFRLENVPPVVALSPELYFVPEKIAAPTPRPARIPRTAKFVPGPIGQARHLPASASVRFDRGAPRPDGGYDNFPGYEGTIEFYFRPNWSTRELTFADNLVYRTFIGSRSTRLYYRYGKAHMPSTAYAFVDLLVPGRGEGYGNDYGTALRIFFQEGRWYHFAGTWRIDRKKQGEVNGDFAIFLDGKRTSRGRFYPHELTKAKAPFTIREVTSKLAIGPMDGTIDELRISDVVRYHQDFPPATEPFTPDAHTTALFHFDGSDEGYLRGGK